MLHAIVKYLTIPRPSFLLEAIRLLSIELEYGYVSTSE